MAMNNSTSASPVGLPMPWMNARNCPSVQMPLTPNFRSLNHVEYSASKSALPADNSTGNLKSGSKEDIVNRIR